MPSYNYISRVMNKYDDSPIKQSSFFQKFSGKVSKVPRLGINAILLREQFEKELGLQIEFKSTKSNIFTKQTPFDFFRSSSSAELDPIQQKLRLYSKNPETEQTRKHLQRNPSERLPPIRRQNSDPKQPESVSRIREKLKSEQVRKDSAAGQKYRGLKYPPRLSEKALRFFNFSELQMKTKHRSVKN